MFPPADQTYFAPLSKIEGHMMLVEKGEFVEMSVPHDCKNEIVSLKRVFNHMIRGLDLLHAQINPHFLYNTLDALQCINSYLTILNIRYDERIAVIYDVERIFWIAMY